MNDTAVGSKPADDAAADAVSAADTTVARVAVVEDEKPKVALDKPSGKSAAVNKAPAKKAPAKRENAGAGDSGSTATPAWLPDWLRSAAVPVLVGAIVVFTGLAVFFGIAAAERRGTPAAANTALVDPPATAQVSGELSDALVSVYSYDFARLDENEKAALAVSTPAYAEKYKQVFGVIREQAPKLQAVMSAVVRKAAVQSIEGDRAVLVAFIDQRGTRVAEGGKADETSASGRVEVIGERVDGKWKVADVIVE
ncbi:hypothetical protein [Pseudonocardia sp. TRM90224]|uniref:hypothetical protein n=1 Tax=Pseudonocardia sp. TRM90224 TaxID=2812678 RepID=UPI001E3C8F2B|nr:hypothetical protein [Pseudonocardia sp. TRM90224]